MCEHISKIKTFNHTIEIKYEIIGFHSESDTDWLFEVQAVERRVDYGRWKPYEKSPEFLAFSKKKFIRFEKQREEGEIRNNPIYELKDAPPFYNKLRNKAVLTGQMKIQGDDAPPLEDGDLFT